MDEKTMLKVEQMLQSNYQFLDFSNEEGHDLWFEMLKPYSNDDVIYGIRQYMKTESKTPTIADLIEFIQPINERRIAEARHNLAVLNANKVNCMECNDRGYVWIQYPRYECCRPCGCASGIARFGEQTSEENRPYKAAQDLVGKFGGKTEAEAAEMAKQYKKVIYYRGENGHDVVIRYEKKG